MLVAARTLQGTFGAILAPSALGTLISIFRDPRERGRAFGVFGSVAGGGGRGPHLIFAAVAVAGALIYMQGNLQQVKGYSPVTCGLAFLPMFGCILASSNTSSSGTASSSGAGDTISSRA